MRLPIAVGVAVAIVSLGIPWVASADSVAVDGDVADTSNSRNSKFILCPGVGSSVDVVATISYSGSGKGASHFLSGSIVSVTASVPASAAEFLTAAGAFVEMRDWNDQQDSVTTPAMPMTVAPGWTEGTYVVDYTISGTTQDGKPYVLTDKNNVEVTEATEGCGPDDGGGEEPPANTAPRVNVTGFEADGIYEVGTVITPGCDVRDAEDVDESALPSVGALTGPLAAYGLGTVTVTCSYTDKGQLTGTDVATYTVVDTGAPVITDLGPTPEAPDGSNGWYVNPVTNTFRATDSGAGFETLAPRLLSYEITGSTGTAEGANLTVSSGSVTDVAGNVAESVNSGLFDVDLTDPQLNVSGPTDHASFDLCAAGNPTRPTFDPFDGVSGVNDELTGDTWVSPTTASGVGSYTYAATAFDHAGRSATETRTFTSQYGSAFAGVQQPINGGATESLADDNSRFKLGSTVPVKFKLVCGTAPIDNAVARLNVKKSDGTPDPGTEEAVSTAASTSGNLFRYDSTSGQYIFNLSTKSGYTNTNATTVLFAAGTYTLSIMLDDGTFRSVNIQLVR